MRLIYVTSYVNPVVQITLYRRVLIPHQMRLSCVWNSKGTQIHRPENLQWMLTQGVTATKRLLSKICVHKMVAKGRFIPQLFEERHFQHKCVSGSCNGWTAPPKEQVDEIIEFCPEVMEVTSDTPPIQSSNELNAALVFNPFSQK